MSNETPTNALRLVPRRAVYDWIRDDVPLNVKLTITPQHVDALLSRLSKAAPASPLPEGGGEVDLRDKAEGLEADLRQAVLVAWKRGAEEWCRLNYPQWVEWLEACHAPAAPTGAK